MYAHIKQLDNNNFVFANAKKLNAFLKKSFGRKFVVKVSFFARYTSEQNQAH
jgi:hypothetical protein